jgi:hypothetical protein
VNLRRRATLPRPKGFRSVWLNRTHLIAGRVILGRVL